MRKYEIWDNESPLVLGNGKSYDKDFIKKQFYIADGEKALLIIEDERVIEISPLSIYIEMLDIQEADEIKILEYIRENNGNNPEVGEETE